MNADDPTREPVDWDGKLAMGECTLEAALMMTLHEGRPASPYLVERLETAFNEQRDGGMHLHESFGSPRDGKANKAIRKEVRRANIVELVDWLHGKFPEGHAEHLPMSDAEVRKKDGATAFTRAGDILYLSPYTVRNAYYGQ